MAARAPCDRKRKRQPASAVVGQGTYGVVWEEEGNAIKRFRKADVGCVVLITGVHMNAEAAAAECQAKVPWGLEQGFDVVDEPPRTWSGAPIVYAQHKDEKRTHYWAGVPELVYPLMTYNEAVASDSEWKQLLVKNDIRLSDGSLVQRMPLGVPFYEAARRWPKEFGRGLASFFAKVLKVAQRPDNGFFHNDIKADNVCVFEGEGGLRFALVDCDSMQRVIERDRPVSYDTFCPARQWNPPPPTALKSLAIWDSPFARTRDAAEIATAAGVMACYQRRGDTPCWYIGGALEYAERLLAFYGQHKETFHYTPPRKADLLRTLKRLAQPPPNSH